jgi:hypothetical protein
MFCYSSKSLGPDVEQGQVLAEAVVVMVALMVLLGAIHFSGRWQYQWMHHWLTAQVDGDALALDHQGLPGNLSTPNVLPDQWHGTAQREFRIGDSHWHVVNTEGRFSQNAWRLKAAGQASTDLEVVERIGEANALWQRTALSSQAVATPLMPALKAIEGPWRDRGPALQWLGRWQGSTPGLYLDKYALGKRWPRR